MTLHQLLTLSLTRANNDPYCISDDPERSDYLCDMISEAADYAVHFDRKSLFQFMADHPEEAEEALDEFGFDGCGKTLEGVAQMAEYLYTERMIYESLSDLITVVLIRGMYNAGHAPEEDAEPYREALKSYADRVETCDPLCDIVQEFLLQIEDEAEENAI